jgi:hypothetical protein
MAKTKSKHMKAMYATPLVTYGDFYWNDSIELAPWVDNK